MEVSGKTLSDQDRTFCQPCSEEGENIDADAFCTVCKEFLCSTCENEHRTFKATKRHTLIDKTNMPTSMTEKSHKEDTNVQCDIHPNEFIKYFCPAHETINCGHCLAFEHRSCKISLISEISDSFETSQDYGNIQISINRLLKDVNDCVSGVESNIKMVLKLGEDEIKKLNDYREKVNNYFNEREKSLLEIIEQIKDMDKTKLDFLKPKCDEIKAKLDEMKCKLDAQERNSVNLFIKAKKVRKQVESLEASLNDISKENTVQRYEFIKDTATEKLITTGSGLGIVSKDQKTGNQTVPIDLTSLKFTKVPGILVKSSSDIGECRLTSMLLLPGNRLLVSDHNNSTLKLVDLQTSSMISRIKLPGMPWGMCVLPADKVAVCLYDKSSIVFLETRGQITIGTSIKVEAKCYDIAYHNDQLVVSFEFGNIVKMDMEGNSIKKMDTVNGQALFNRCCNMTLMDDGRNVAICVSDYHNHTVTKLDIDLNILQTFNDPAIQNPRGLTAFGNQLLICSNGTNKIVRLDMSSGTMIQLLGESDGIQHPYSAVYNPEQNKLHIVSNGYRTNDLTNKVQVFKAS
ncbi:uncharacterized protein LOC128236498 [Mya arenaria]|uniref:uncharacterized protein LOC128236498 n=1 Tax=Mya arenaria TaxID=6604 RepID=UPI0022E0DBD2|nr:uncharacterized protein LOC128236498 [Mya arenaria]